MCSVQSNFKFNGPVYEHEQGFADSDYTVQLVRGCGQSRVTRTSYASILHLVDTASESASLLGYEPSLGLVNNLSMDANLSHAEHCNMHFYDRYLNSAKGVYPKSRNSHSYSGEKTSLCHRGRAGKLQPVSQRDMFQASQIKVLVHVAMARENMS